MLFVVPLAAGWLVQRPFDAVSRTQSTRRSVIMLDSFVLDKLGLGAAKSKAAKLI